MPTPFYPAGSEISEIEAHHASVLAAFAHDLRSPLSSIRTGIEVLKLSLGNPQQAGKIIEMLERQTQEITRLLEGLVTTDSLTAEGHEPAQVIKNPTTPRQVLVVDDSRSAADILTVFFNMEGMAVRTAYLGEDALQLVREMLPDVVFLDLGLPDLSGYEVAAKIRACPGGEHCFIVALTGRDEEDDRKKIAAAGFDFHVVKPPEPDLLRDVLRKSTARVL